MRTRRIARALTVAAVLATPLVALALRGAAGLDGLLWGVRSAAPALWDFDKHEGGVNYGVYDPDRAFVDARGVAIEHVFVSWLAGSGSQLASTAAYARERNRWLMVTVEPWPGPAPGGRDGLLRDVTLGRYDRQVETVCRQMAGLGVPVFVRWGHEMEVPTGRYPWAHDDARLFVAAYRHFVDGCRRHAPEAFFVWSPRGDSGLERYYPGRPYADYVGVSVYAFPAWEIDHHQRPRPFREIFGERYERVKSFDRPVMIAELGVQGTPRYQAAWMDDGFRSMRQFPLLRSVVYFNAKDSVGAWDEKYGVPQWQIDPSIFE
jgi:cellulose synthase (UDP-forming)